MPLTDWDLYVHPPAPENISIFSLLKRSEIITKEISLGAAPLSGPLTQKNES